MRRRTPARRRWTPARPAARMGLLLLVLGGLVPLCAACPAGCECQTQPPQLLCANRGLRAVPRAPDATRVFALGGNRIGNLSALDFRNCGDLVRLNLQYNQIRGVHPRAFEKLSKLEELYLGHNRLSRVHAGTLQPLRRLTVFYGDHNRITDIAPGVFADLDRLVKLRLDGNAIGALRESAFSRLGALNALLLSRNRIRRVGGGVFRDLRRLSTLSLSDNRISRLDGGALEGLSALRELFVDGNRLEEIPAGLLDPLERVEELDFSRNRISNVHPLAFAALKGLRVLKLKSNLLTTLTLPGATLALNSFLQDLDLHGNDWTCDCRLEELRRWMAAARSRGKTSTVSVRCHHPAWLRGRYLDQVATAELKPPGNRTGTCEGRGGGPAATAGSDGVEKRKREGHEEEGIQGDQGGMEAVGGSPPAREEALRSGSQGAKGKRGSKLTARTVVAGEDQEKPLTNAPQIPPGERFGLLRSDREEISITDPCVFNRRFIGNVSAGQVTSSTGAVRWSAADHDPVDVRYRILYDRFDTSDRFPRYVYAHGSSRSVTLRELRPDTTYVACVEGVVGGSVCQVAPRDHCAGLVTLTETSPLVTSDLQLMTTAALVGNAVLVLIVGAVWLGRYLKKRLQRRKSAVHVRHMYSTRRPFRPAASASADFTRYQSSRPARLAPLEEGDLIEFPFQDSSCARDMTRFSE